MRALHRLALAFVPSALLACTALLGDFKVGDNGDGSPDVNGGDAPADVSGDVIAQDASDASDSSTVQPIKCTEDSNSRIQLNQSFGQQYWDTIQIAKASPTQIRTVVAAQGGSSGNGVHAFLLNTNNKNVTHVTPTGTTIQQVLDLQRFQDRFVALTWDDDGTGNKYFSIYQLLDSSNTWDAPIQLTTGNPLASGDASAIDRLEATVMPDPTFQNFFLVVFDLEQSDTVTYLRAANEKVGNPQPLVTIDTSQAPFAYELKSPSIVMDATHAFLYLGGNGPQTTSSLLYTMALQNTAAVAPRVIQSTTGAAYFPLVFTNSPAQGFADIGVLMANLNTIQASWQIGQVALPNLGTFDPINLPTTTLPKTDSGVTSVPDLLIDKAEAHLDTPGVNQEHVLAWARTADTSGPLGGYNFEWWDAKTGAVRSRQTGATNLFKDVNDGFRAASTLQGPPSNAFAQFYVAFEREPPTDSGQNGSSYPGDVWFATLTCILQ